MSDGESDKYKNDGTPVLGASPRPRRREDYKNLVSRTVADKVSRLWSEQGMDDTERAELTM